MKFNGEISVRSLVIISVQTIAFLLVTGVIMVVLAGYAAAQTVEEKEPNPPIICLYHPETLMVRDPAARQVMVAFRFNGWPQMHPALPNIRREWASKNYYRQFEAIQASIQYSIYNAQMVEEAKRVSIRDYYPVNPPEGLPNWSLDKLIRVWLWSTNFADQNLAARSLGRVIESPLNRACNPWRPYQGEWR